MAFMRIPKNVNTAVLSNFPFSDGHEYAVFPGFCDVHVHLREPGFSYKETIRTGTLAAARGGFTDVCAMPNLNPVPDTAENLKVQTDLIAKDAVVGVHPYGALTMGEKGKEIARLEEMAPNVIAFSDDGKGVQDAGMMREIMQRVKKLGKIVAAHCEVDALINGGAIHLGAYAAAHGIKGIPSECEWRMIERDLNLAAETGCAYHVCHISCAESVRLIGDAKKSGVNVTCETAPHYLALDEGDLRDEGRFKMNPPIRARSDREALLRGIADGTVDMIATDHAPHSENEKVGGLQKSLNGIVGLETSFPVLYTELVRKGVISLEKLVDLMSFTPRRRFGLDAGDDVTVWQLDVQTRIDSGEFLSMGHSTPFEGKLVYGINRLTVHSGSAVYTA